MKYHHLILFLLLLTTNKSFAQLPGFYNTILGPSSLSRGLTNVLGGVFTIDQKHKGCLQKTLCDEMSAGSEAVRRVTDPISREDVEVTDILMPRGRIRILIDRISDWLFAFADRAGLTRRFSNLKRRQGVAAAATSSSFNLVGAAMSTMSRTIGLLEMDDVLKWMDFGVDRFNLFERQGPVYPYFKSGVVGMGYGGDANLTACKKLVPDCGDEWSKEVPKTVQKTVFRRRSGGISTRRNDNNNNYYNYDYYSSRAGEAAVATVAATEVVRTYTPGKHLLGIVNSYYGGGIDRMIQEKHLPVRNGVVDSPFIRDNNLPFGDFLQPKVLTCRLNKFLKVFTEPLGGGGEEKSSEKSSEDKGEEKKEEEHHSRSLREVKVERFGSEMFEKSCDPAFLEEQEEEAANNVGNSAAAATADVPADAVPVEEIEIVDARKSHKNGTKHGVEKEEHGHNHHNSNNNNNSSNNNKNHDSSKGEGSNNHENGSVGDHNNSSNNNDHDDNNNNHNSSNNHNNNNEEEGFSGLPVYAFENLPDPAAGETEEHLLENLVLNNKYGQVRSALRLPLQHSLVLAELDSDKVGQEVLKHKEELNRSSAKMAMVGVRRASYRELWKYLGQVSAVKAAAHAEEEAEADEVLIDAKKEVKKMSS